MELVVLLPYAPWFGLALSLFGTWLHTFVDETLYGDGAPFWDYSADLLGVRPPWLAGFVLFVFFTLALSAIGVLAYGFGSFLALSLLLGMRTGDVLGSHVALAALYKRPNPGLATAPVYVIEAAFSLLWLWGEHQLHRLSWQWALLGFWVFAGPWVIALPYRRLTRRGTA